MIKPLCLYVLLILGLAYVSATDGRAELALTRGEALRELMSYRGVLRRLHATFPQAITNTPPLTSMGPSSVSENCFAGWRRTMNNLQQEGYLTSFRDTDDQIALASTDLTAKGKTFFDHLTAGSIYCTVRLIPDLGAADARVGDIKLSADGKRARIEFRSKLSEPFRIMQANSLFVDGCGAELNPAVVIDEEYAVGHAHFKSKKGRWKIEKVLLGQHSTEE